MDVDTRMAMNLLVMDLLEECKECGRMREEMLAGKVAKSFEGGGGGRRNTKNGWKWGEGNRGLALLMDGVEVGGSGWWSRRRWVAEERRKKVKIRQRLNNGEYIINSELWIENSHWNFT